jgi:hypothetical protein
MKNWVFVSLHRNGQSLIYRLKYLVKKYAEFINRSLVSNRLLNEWSLRQTKTTYPFYRLIEMFKHRTLIIRIIVQEHFRVFWIWGACPRVPPRGRPDVQRPGPVTASRGRPALRPEPVSAPWSRPVQRPEPVTASRGRPVLRPEPVSAPWSRPVQRPEPVTGPRGRPGQRPESVSALSHLGKSYRVVTWVRSFCLPTHEWMITVFLHQWVKRWIGHILR